MKEGRRVNSQRLTAGGQRIKVGRMLTVVCCLLAVVCTAQNAQVNFTAKSYPFVHNERNEIVNDKVLDSFFSKLYMQRTQKNQRISIYKLAIRIFRQIISVQKFAPISRTILAMPAEV